MVSYEDFIKRIETLEKKQTELELIVETLREEVLKTKLKLIQPLNDLRLNEMIILITDKVGVFPFKETSRTEQVFARSVLYYILHNYYKLKYVQIETLVKKHFKKFKPKTKDMRSTIQHNINGIETMLNLGVEKNYIEIYNEILDELNLKK